MLCKGVTIMSTFGFVSVFAVSAMLVNALGIYAIYKNRMWAEKNKEYFMCFAAGILITSPLIGAFPEAISKNSEAGFFALLGFLFMFATSQIMRKSTKKSALAFGYTALIGIGIHSFVDGMIYSVTFTQSSFLGILAGTGLVTHEFAEGVITYAFLTEGGLSEKKAILYAFLVASLTTPIGAFLIYPLLRNFTSSVMGLLLGFVTGVLIYISAAHLLPEASEHEKDHSYMSFLTGVGFSILLYFIK